MRYIVILGDGMADLPLPKIDNKTPLEVAHKPYMDKFAKMGVMGKIRTVYEGLKPGSDVANLCVMGFDPSSNYSGRSPLEAASIGVELSDTDITYRANIVTLSDEENYSDKKMIDYSAGEISTKEAREIIKTVSQKLGNEIFSFFAGISYRHLLLRKDMKKAGSLTPPHDISGKPVKDFLPEDKMILDLMEKSYEILKDHPVNIKRIKEGKNPANSIWVWGEGTKPKLENYKEKFGITGTVISAVDLIKGIAILSGLKSVDVPGATGNVHTNFDGKTKAAIDAIKNGDEYIYLHIEAADESGHQGSLSDKIKSIELIDEKVIKPIYEYLVSSGEEFRMLVLPDHPTPISLKTHTCDPVPFVLIKNTDKEIKNDYIYSEADAEKSGIYFDRGHTLMNEIINNKIWGGVWIT